MSDFTPNPIAVRRITAHLLGEDMRNVKAAVESFPNGYTVVPKDAAAAPSLHCPDPEHPGGAYCRDTTGLMTCYPPEHRGGTDG